MRLMRVFVVLLILLSIISMTMQVLFSTKEVYYTPIHIQLPWYESVYSPSAIALKVSVNGGIGMVTIRDIELNETLIFENIYHTKIFSFVFPHPGTFEISVSENSTGSFVVVLSPIEVGFPRSNWNSHLMILSFSAFILAILLWRETK